MPITFESPNKLGNIGTLPKDPTIEENAPDFYNELLPAAFRRENTIGSFLYNKSGFMTRDDSAESINDDFNPFENIEGYELYANSFAFANSADDVSSIKSQIDQEKEDYKTIESGGWMGTLASISAGVLDPINLIPVGGAAIKTARVGESVLNGALSASRAAIIGSSVSEIALHTSQETRTLGESAANVGGAALLGSIIGGASGALGSHLMGKKISQMDLVANIEKDLTIPKDSEIDILSGQKISLDDSEIELISQIGEGGSVGAAAIEKIDTKIKPIGGLENFSTAPNMRTITSRDSVVRSISEDLADNPFYLTKNEKGMPTKISAETEIRAVSDRFKYAAYKAIEDEFVSYRGSGLKRTNIADKFGQANRKGVLTFDRFKEEISYAMRNGDIHEIPKVQEAARKAREIFDHFKNEAIKYKIFPEDVKVKTSETYFTRMYDRDRIIANREDFKKNALMKWLSVEHPNIERVELQDIADQIIDHILGTPGGMPGYVPVPLSRGPMKERVLNIPDNMIAKYLINDAEVVINRYIDVMSADIALAKRFGTPDMKVKIQEVVDSYNRKINAVSDADKNAQNIRDKLIKERNREIKDIEFMRDKLRGISVNSANVFNNAIFGTIKSLNYARLLGGVVLSAIPDIASPVLMHGITRTIGDTIVPLVRRLGSISSKISGKKSAYAQSIQELKDMGLAVDILLNTRASSLADINNEFAQGGLAKFNRNMSNNLSYYSGISAWNDKLKTMAGYMGMARILRAAESKSLSKKEIEFMARFGLSKEDLSLIGDQYKKFGKKEGGRYAAGINEWTSREAYDKFHLSIRKIVDNTILNPGLDKPMFFSSEVGSIIGQFKSFSFAAYQRYFLAGLQQRDMATLGGALTMTSLGMMSYYIKSVLSGNEVSDDPKKWITEGIDKSGLLGFVMDINNTIEKFSGGRIGISALSGAGPMSRYKTRSAAASLFGPTYGLFEDLAQSTSSLTGYFMDDQALAPSDISAMRRLIPYQNVVAFRKLFDMAESGLKNNLGIE